MVFQAENILEEDGKIYEVTACAVIELMNKQRLIKTLYDDSVIASSILDAADNAMALDQMGPYLLREPHALLIQKVAGRMS